MRLCLQPAGWAATNLAQATLPEMADSADFELTADQATTFGAFATGEDFDEVIMALDEDETRINLRQMEKTQTQEITEELEEINSRKVADWSEAAIEELPPMPRIALDPKNMFRLSNLLEMDPGGPKDRTDEDHLEIASIIHTTLYSLAYEVNELQWKCDYLKSVNTNQTAGGDDIAGLKRRFPFLHDVDAHVWAIPFNQECVALARSSNGDKGEQVLHRQYRDEKFHALAEYWGDHRTGGDDYTFRTMPDHVKVDLVNAMASAPTFWSAKATLMKAETKISSDRCNQKKRVRRTNTQTRTHNNSLSAHAQNQTAENTRIDHT